jgi:hypothetical protein
MAVTTRLQDAMNTHYLEALLDCFHEDYRSEQPVHPGRGFGGETKFEPTGQPSSQEWVTSRLTS